MKVVIQCAGRKHFDAGTLRGSSGERIIFVAHPDSCDAGTISVRYCRPDDAQEPGAKTWRDSLDSYNRGGENPYLLRQAGELYQPKIYRELMEVFGLANTFILSAGWGLIRSSFLTPNYDITFSNQGKPWARRKKKLTMPLRDFNHLEEIEISPEEEIHFFGGKDYLALYYELTRRLPGRKIIHHKGSVPIESGYEYVKWNGSRNQNWHYSAAQAFIHALPESQ